MAQQSAVTPAQSEGTTKAQKILGHGTQSSSAETTAESPRPTQIATISDIVLDDVTELPLGSVPLDNCAERQRYASRRQVHRGRLRHLEYKADM